MDLTQEASINLCNGCRIAPWGEEGWDDFFSGVSFRSRFAWMREKDDMPEKLIAYSIKPEALYRGYNTNSCDWCSLLVTNLSPRLPETLEIVEKLGWKEFGISLEFKAPQNVEPRRVNIILVRCFANTEHGFSMFSTYVGVSAIRGRLADQIFFSPEPVQDYQHGFNSDLARKWIEPCIANHEACKGDLTTPKLPTRILEISGETESSLAVILRDSMNEELSQYACLSYKWGLGRSHDFSAIAHSIYNNSIDIHQLPLTFRDGVRVAHGLGLRYLWIDALCIWQGDPLDLQLELSVMHTYYTEATLVILTSGTDSVDEGFLDSARNSKLTNIQSAKGSENALFNIPFRSEDKEHDVICLDISPKDRWYCESDQHASSRGWIFQEQVLCRRILIFPSGGGMIFHCDTKVSTDSHDGNVFYGPFTVTRRQRWGKEKIYIPSDNDMIPLMDISSFGGRVLAQINRLRQLSETRDKSKNPPELQIVELSTVLCLDPQSADMANIGPDVTRISIPHVEVVLADGTKATPKHHFLQMRRGHGPPVLVTTDPPSGFILPVTAMELYKRLVTEYCARKLSIPSDKLIAMSALSREYHRRYAGVLGAYHAGLWTNFAATGLLWYVGNPEAPVVEYRAPSWSWASVEGARYTDPRNAYEGGVDFQDLDVEVLHIESTLAETSLTFGAVTGGYMEVNAMLLDLYWASARNEAGTTSFKVYRSADDREPAIKGQAWPDHKGCMPGQIRLPVTLLLGRRYIEGVGHNEDHLAEILLLRRQEDGVYNRVGFARLDLEQYHRDWESLFRKETVKLV